MSNEQPRSGKRRRGRRGRGGGSGAGSASGDGQQPPNDSSPPGPPGPAAAADTSAGSRSPRRDTRGQARPERTGGRTHRAPGSDRPGEAGARSERAPRRDGPPDRGSRGGDRGSGRDRAPRVYEEIVPQDPTSIELGAKFKESQIAMRDARKALAKRKAEFDDEPEWMLEQLAEAERAFEGAATAWAEHLEKTGRKVVRR